MKKRWIFIVGFILLTILTASCAGNRHQDIDLQICGGYAVPGMLCYDLKGNFAETTIIETDGYDRVLFCYTTESVITENEESVLVICQASNSDSVFYYEDICYLMGTPSEDDLKAFKEINDWDKPLVWDKMSKRSNRITFDLNVLTDSSLDMEKVKKQCGNKLAIFDLENCNLSFLDVDPQGTELYWFVAGSRNYFVFSDSQYNITLHEVQDPKDAQQSLPEYKAQYGGVIRRTNGMKDRLTDM